MSGRFPTSDSNVASAADFILTGAQEIRDIHNPNTGKNEPTVTVNAKQIQWMSQTVTSNRLGDLAFELERLETLAAQAVYNTTTERAALIRDLILGLCSAVMYGVNAKSSETIRDNRNQHNNLIQMFTKQQSPYIKEMEEIKSGVFGNLLKKKEQEE